MSASPFTHRLAALGLLIGGVALAGSTATALLHAYLEGQWEIADKQAQLRGLRELAEARSAFERLAPRKSGSAPLILPADADAAATLNAAVTRAAEGQQVIVDGIDAPESEPVSRTAAVHLRATQAGLYGFLRTVEAQVPYLVVSRLEVTPSRSADPEHGKPLVLSADLRLAALVAPAVPSKRGASTPPPDPAAP